MEKERLDVPDGQLNRRWYDGLRNIGATLKQVLVRQYPCRATYGTPRTGFATPRGGVNGYIDLGRHSAYWLWRLLHQGD